MNLKHQKKLAGGILKVSKKKVALDPSRLEDIKEAITKTDVRSLVREGVIQVEVPSRNSRHRARKRQVQKNKGLRKGTGRRKGSYNARADSKETWMNRIRLQRDFIASLKENGSIDNTAYKDLYSKVKGGFFRSKRHIKLYVTDKGYFKESQKS
ncbi:50S ribosomal protein L19e [Candidatus Woesearchaeota archaeon]|nr:50S ribosomal protein L19e [Candidatus Woesearchaeota archaeon]